MARKPVLPCVGEGLVVRRVVMRAKDVVFFKGLAEASEGLAAVFAERGGDLTVAAPADRAHELDAWLDEIARELSAMTVVQNSGSEHDARGEKRSP